MTREERNAKQREIRARNGNASTKKYEKTKRGFLMRMYRNMESRVKGIQWRKKHLYDGKELMSREQFYEFANNNQDFHRLFEVWQSANYERRLAPSIDRINSQIGYTLDNIRFVTFSENCRNVTRWKKN